MYNFWNVILEKIAGRGLSDKFHVATRRRNRQRENTKAGPTESAGAAHKIYSTQVAAPERIAPTAVWSGNVLHANRIRFAVAFGRSGKGQSTHKKPEDELAKPVVTETKALETRERAWPFERWGSTTADGYPAISSRFGWPCEDAGAPRVRQFITENIGSLYPVVKRDIEKLPGFPGWHELCKALEDEYTRTHTHYVWQARLSVAAWIASQSRPSVRFSGSVGPRPSWAKTSSEEQQHVPREEDEESESYTDDGCAIESCSLSELSFLERETFMSSRLLQEQDIQTPATAVQSDDQQDEKSGSCTADEWAIESYDPIELSFLNNGPAHRPVSPHQPSTWTRDILAPTPPAAVAVNDKDNGDNEKGEDAASSSGAKHGPTTGIADAAAKPKYRLIKIKGMRVFCRVRTTRRPVANVDQQDHSPVSVAEAHKQEQEQEQKDDIREQAITASVQRAHHLWGKARMDPETGDVLGYAEAEAPPPPAPVIPSTTLESIVRLQRSLDGDFVAVPGTNLRESIENYGAPWGAYYARCNRGDGLRRPGADVDAPGENRETMPRAPIYAGLPKLGRLEHLQDGDFWPLPGRRRLFRLPEAPEDENSYISRWGGRFSPPCTVSMTVT
ncbi:hypothetical protein VTN02DRAFT_399 [Thermoascus thermophilus]